MFRASDPDIALPAGSAPHAPAVATANALPLVRRANRALDAVWSRGLLPEPRLEEDAIAEAALRAEGATYFEDEHWRDPLRWLLRDLAGPARLNPLGRAMAWGQLVRILRSRLKAERRWRRHPEIAGRDIVAPVVVLGQMRSGTTRVQRLLACDPRLAHTRCYENSDPAGRGTFARSARTWAGLGAIHRLNPALQAIHPTSPRAPEEEFGLLAFSLYGAQLEAQWRLPYFARCWEAADKQGVYGDFRSLLRTIGWARGEAAGRPWLLKAPQFMEDLDALLAAFPDARLLCLHRDPAAVVASSASLVWNQMRVQSDAADKMWVAQEWLSKSVRRARLSSAVRSQAFGIAQLGIDYEAVNGDWRREMRRVYDFLGMSFPDSVEERMAAYLARSEAAGFRGHRYSLEDFGLSADMVARAFETCPA